MLRRENICSSTRVFQRRQNFFYLEFGIYPSITDIVEAINTLIQKIHNHIEICFKVKVSRRKHKVEIYFANERSGLAFCNTDLGHIFGSNVGNVFGIMLRGKGPQKPKLAYGIVRIHSLMIYTDLIGYNIVGDTKAPLLRCFRFISKLKAGDIKTTWQYMNYLTFSNLQFRPPLKNFSQSFHFDLRNASCENLPFVSVGIIRLVLMFRKVSDIHF